MGDINYLDGLAYAKTEGQEPCIVFLPGYRSDMEGTKAVHLNAWARERGRAFLRFDYSGHGRSHGVFEEGSIGAWAADAQKLIKALAPGPVVLVGSSMGGWIGCILSKRLELAGFVGIAAAPDFTEDGFWANLNEEQRQIIMQEGQITLPSSYEDPYILTRNLIMDGRENLVLRTPLRMGCRVRLLQGTQDQSVSRETALRLLDHIEADDLRLTLVRGADHSFSDEKCLSLIEAAIEEVAP